MSDPSLSGMTVVFDLDGTLVDTAPDLVDTLNIILAREHMAPIAYAHARTMIGGGVKPLLERGLRADGRVLPPGELDRLYTDFLAYYVDHIADRSRPFPGLEAALDRIAASGAKLAVCTNKLEGLSVRLLDALGLSSRFGAICGQDTFGIIKPDPEILRRTIVQAGGTPDAALMVGDSDTDIRTAKALGVPVIAVDFGYTPIPVADLNPDRIISHFDDLPASVFDLLDRQSRLR